MTSVLPSPEEYARLTPTPGTPVWRAFNDVRLLGSAGYATLLQVAHPTVGAGVHQYSSFTKDPTGRLLRTLDYVHGTVYGGPRLAGEIGARVRGMHTDIKGETHTGERYHAMEPEAFAWVHATLASAIFVGYERFARPMSPRTRQAFWTQWRDVGRLVGVRYRDLPEDVREFDDYFDRMVDERLDWTPAIPEVIGLLGDAAPPPGVPIPRGLWNTMMRPGSWGFRIVTTGLLPARLRPRLRLSWSARDARTFRAVCVSSRASAPLIVGPLANFGPNYVRSRRKALARGDVASGGVAARTATA